MNSNFADGRFYRLSMKLNMVICVNHRCPFASISTDPTPPPHTAPIHAQLHPSRSVQYDIRISAYLWVYKDIIFLSVFHK